MKNRKQLNALVRSVKILAFGGVLALMSLIGLLWFLRPETSVLEKRDLSKFPEFTLQTFWDGSYFSQIDTWYADTYPMREPLISANQFLQSHYGIQSDQIVGEAMVADAIPDPATVTAAPVETSAEPTAEPTPAPSPSPLPDGTITEVGEMQGNIYITNNCGYGLYYFNQNGADTFAKAMNQIYQNHKDDINLYIMTAPISAGVMLDQSVLDDMNSSDEGEAIKYVYAQLDPGIHAINVYDNLRAHNAEYIYFHTDHHWTHLGAYYAYEMFCQDKGWEPHKLEDYETITFEGFLGTFYSSSNKSAALASNPDTVVAYIPNGTNKMHMLMQDGTEYDWDIVHDVSNYVNTEYYATFAGGDRPFSYAHNETITDGSAVMVIKDSYGNAFIPWLVDHYEYVYWVDYRYTTNTISQMVEDYGIQDVIYQCTIYTGTSTSALEYFEAIGR